MVVEVCSRRDPDFRRMHQVRNLVLNDAQGAVEGMVLVLLDVTERYSAEERFERTFNANPAPAVICSLADLRYVKVNQGFLEMTATRARTCWTRPCANSTCWAMPPQREDALQRLAEGRTIPQTESSIAVQGRRQQAGGGGGPAHRGGRAALHAVHLQRPGAAPQGRDGAAPQRAALRHGVPGLAPVPMTLSTAEGQLLRSTTPSSPPPATTPRRCRATRTHWRGLWTDPRAYDRAMASLEQGASVRSLEWRARARRAAGLLLSAAPVNIQDLPCVLGAIQTSPSASATNWN